MSVKPILAEGETFDNKGDTLNGKTAEIIQLFQKRLVGKTIVDAGYMIDEDQEPWPCLVMDNGHLLIGMMDDEGNGPGVMCFQDARLCQTSKRQTKKAKVDE